MMRSYKKVALLILLLATVLAVAVAAMQGDKQNGSKSVEHARANVDEFPVADFNPPEITDARKRAKRQKRSARYGISGDPKGYVFSENSQSLWGSPPIEHIEAMQPLPVTSSDAIIIGEVTGAQAHLSADKTNVYSEFAVRVDEVLKDACSGCAMPLQAGASVDAVGDGGAVRLPSGRVLFRGSGVYGLPRVSRRYVFFLKRNVEGEDYTLNGGYELRGDRVFPLDGVSPPVGRQREIYVVPQFATYVGKDQSAFMDELREAIARVQADKQTRER